MHPSERNPAYLRIQMGVGELPRYPFKSAMEKEAKTETETGFSFFKKKLIVNSNYGPFSESCIILPI